MQGHFRANQNFVLLGVNNNAGHKALGHVEVVRTRLVQFGTPGQECLCLRDLFRELFLVAETKCLMGAHVYAVRQLACVNQVSAARALLGNLKLVVPEDGVVGASVHEFFFALCLFGVNNDQAVFALVNCFGSNLHAGSIVAVLAALGNVGQLNLRHLAAHLFLNAGPELTGVGLGHCIGQPLVVNVLVFAGELAVAAAVAFCGIKNKHFCHNYSPLTMRASATRPQSGS